MDFSRDLSAATTAARLLGLEADAGMQAANDDVTIGDAVDPVTEAAAAAAVAADSVLMVAVTVQVVADD